MYQVSQAWHQLRLKTKLKLKIQSWKTQTRIHICHIKTDKNVSLVTTERLYDVSKKNNKKNEELYASYYKPDLFLSKSDILRASDFPITSRWLSFFLLSVPFCSSSFFFANAAAYQEWAIQYCILRVLPLSCWTLKCHQCDEVCLSLWQNKMTQDFTGRRILKSTLKN